MHGRLQKLDGCAATTVTQLTEVAQKVAQQRAKRCRPEEEGQRCQGQLTREGSVRDQGEKRRESGLTGRERPSSRSRPEVYCKEKGHFQGGMSKPAAQGKERRAVMDSGETAE